MKKYELIYIVSHQLDEKNLPVLAEKIETAIKQGGGLVSKKDWGAKRKLAFKIKQTEAGFYGIMQFELPPEKAAALNKALRLNSAITRFMLTAIKRPAVRKKVRRLKPKTQHDSDSGRGKTGGGNQKAG
jgi:small subunit ribosomal protein S6